MRKVLLITFVFLLIVTNLIAFRSLMKERALENFYLASTFEDCVEYTAMTLEVLSDELFSKNKIIDNEEFLASVSHAKSEIIIYTKIFLNLRFIDKENLYNADLTPLINYLDKLSKKEIILQEDMNILREIVKYKEDLNNTKIILEKKSFFYTKYYPNKKIVETLEAINTLVKNR
ncbi:hypothetical protein [Geosporobacter ferrireducens]|uniref:Uncharacterized protein n=1 Tax=Geosporobacter ferrireducens TaxID=1424294 RepID=A0A1D8GHL3_9FIRM|nr:hypothetical protein [Geosporobacter ferrireducens]AOT70376.1 hypothetical protein Gferi_12705 [Geosporobacter ferrireducens]MTI54353.1 hypothetical protein [Geosporobacter ferrireducens]